MARGQDQKSDAHESPTLQTALFVEMESRLSFWQRYFCRPQASDIDNKDKNGVTNSSRRRHFSFTSIGSIISGTMLLLILLGAVAAAVAVKLDHHHHSVSTAHPPPIVNTPPPTVDPSSPIRAAIEANFPDPTIWLDSNGTWYAMATTNSAGILDAPNNSSLVSEVVTNIQIATSTDFANWTLLSGSHDPLPQVGEWCTQGTTAKKIPRAGTWAPSIMQRPTDNKFVMYYSANKAAENDPSENIHHPGPAHCLGAAVSENLVGPYEAIKEVLACPVEQGGAIDSAAFKDVDGGLYIVYKIDGNNRGHGGSCGNSVKPIHSTPIMLQKMEDDGTTTDGKPVQILDRIADDGPLVEAPTLVRTAEGVYFLFFSSGCTREPTYNVKYAWSEDITGPYTRGAEPLLQTGDWGLLAPGSVGIHEDGSGGHNMAFHARVTEEDVGGVRAMFTTKLVFDGHNVTMVRDDS